MPISTANMWYNCFVCKKHNSLGVSIKTVTLQANTSLLGCFACLNAYTVSESQHVPDYSPPPGLFPSPPPSSSISFDLPALFSFRSAFSLTLRTTNERYEGVRSGAGIFLLVFFKTLVDLGKSTAEERRRQTLCDKRGNNFHLPLTTNSLIRLSRLSQRSVLTSSSFYCWSAGQDVCLAE